MPKLTSSLFELVAALVGAALVCLGVFLWSVPAGFVVTGIVLVIVAYVARALEVPHGDS